MNKKAAYLNVWLGLILSVSISLITSCAKTKPLSMKGIVQQIDPGKDGYTAHLINHKGNNFDALVSRVRMQQDYRLLRVGDKVKFIGDTIHLNRRVQILVKQIR